MRLKKGWWGSLRTLRKLAKPFRSCHMGHVPEKGTKRRTNYPSLSWHKYETLPEATVVEWVEEEALRMKEVMDHASEGERGPPEPWYQVVLDFLRTGTFCRSSGR
ncbi:hypothetical protein LIER_20219 [Lithospermum erythrorhizon]|uniref:Uncharacterized protein n=1 Tax=Lithospermum erythrorhizon TaxID=34254 RepID=A0AAV3QNU1_LITER